MSDRHKDLYKYSANNFRDEMRWRRQDASIELRKDKREDRFAKRRDLVNVPSTTPQSDDQANIIAMLMPGLVDSNSVKRFEAIQGIRKMLSTEDNPPFHTVIALGLVESMVGFLDDPDSEMQFQAAWALTNIASGTAQETEEIIIAGAVPKLVGLLQSPVPKVVDQAVFALGNIAGDGSLERDLVLSLGVIELLVNMVEFGNLHLDHLRNVTWCMMNLCRGREPRASAKNMKKLIPTLAKLIKSDDKDVVNDATWALAYATDETVGNFEKIDAAVATECVPRLVYLMGCEDLNIIRGATQAVGNIASGSNFHTEWVVLSDALPKLVKLLSHPKESIVQCASWVVSNITAGTISQIQKVLESEVMAPLIKVLAEGEMKAKIDVAWVVSNIVAAGSDNQKQFLLDKYPEVIKPFCDLLISQNTDLTGIAIDCLGQLLQFKKSTHDFGNFCCRLEEIGVVGNLENLQHHKNVDIYAKAYEIIEKYFSDDDNDDLEFLPTINNEPQWHPGNGDGSSFNF